MNIIRFAVLTLLSLILVVTGCSNGTDGSQPAVRSIVSGPGEFDRTVLPIPDPVFPKITELDARKAKAPPAFSVTAPEGAPNVVIVLIDDIGFGAAVFYSRLLMAESGHSIRTKSPGLNDCYIPKADILMNRPGVRL
jgi:hypothetical protein